MRTKPPMAYQVTLERQAQKYSPACATRGSCVVYAKLWPNLVTIHARRGA